VWRQHGKDRKGTGFRGMSERREIHGWASQCSPPFTVRTHCDLVGMITYDETVLRYHATLLACPTSSIPFLSCVGEPRGEIDGQLDEGRSGFRRINRPCTSSSQLITLALIPLCDKNMY
jgi:hypothetical protein